jgi:hypothetical protein
MRCLTGEGVVVEAEPLVNTLHKAKDTDKILVEFPKASGQGPRYHGLPTPTWFKPETADAFRKLEMRNTDVIISSYPKTGTTWLHKVRTACFVCAATRHGDSYRTAPLHRCENMCGLVVRFGRHALSGLLAVLFCHGTWPHCTHMRASVTKALAWNVMSMLSCAQLIEGWYAWFFTHFVMDVDSAHTFTFSLHVQLLALWSCGHASLVPPCNDVSELRLAIAKCSAHHCSQYLCGEEHAWPGGFIHAHAYMALCWPGA